VGKIDQLHHLRSQQEKEGRKIIGKPGVRKGTSAGKNLKEKKK